MITLVRCTELPSASKGVCAPRRSALAAAALIKSHTIAKGVNGSDHLVDSLLKFADRDHPAL